jgi:hypothetical protein
MSVGIDKSDCTNESGSSGLDCTYGLATDGLGNDTIIDGIVEADSATDVVVAGDEYYLFCLVETA